MSIYLEVEFLDHVALLCLILWGISSLLATMPAPFYILISSAKVFYFLTSLSAFVFSLSLSLPSSLSPFLPSILLFLLPSTNYKFIHVFIHSFSHSHSQSIQGIFIERTEINISKTFYFNARNLLQIFFIRYWSYRQYNNVPFHM